MSPQLNSHILWVTRGAARTTVVRTYGPCISYTSSQVAKLCWLVLPSCLPLVVVCSFDTAGSLLSVPPCCCKFMSVDEAAVNGQRLRNAAAVHQDLSLTLFDYFVRKHEKGSLCLRRTTQTVLALIWARRYGV